MTPLTHRAREANLPHIKAQDGAHILWLNFRRKQLSALVGEFECDLAALQTAHAAECIRRREEAPVVEGLSLKIGQVPVMVVEFA